MGDKISIANPDVGEIKTTEEILEMDRMWMMAFYDMMNHLNEFREELEAKKDFPEMKGIDIDEECRIHFEKLMKNKENKRIWEFPEKMKKWKWKLIKK